MNTGMRKSELYALTWNAVDLGRKPITVKAEMSKSGRSRVIPMSAELVELLSALPHVENNPYVFPGRRGK